jgi:N-acyl-D-amino-acid deacylase
MLDLVIRNAAVVDGTGAEPFRADVSVQSGVITAVGHETNAAAREVDGTGLTLAPGFIDVHGHSDLFTGFDPFLAGELEQGITAQLCGQCGLGPAPVSAETLPYYQAYYQKLGAPIHPHAAAFTSFGAYLHEMDHTPTGIHLGYFIPHGTLRLAAMGMSPEVPTAAQLERMETLLDEGMRAGALGLSTGLMYAPGSYAQREELAALARIVGRYHGVYTSHMRNQGDRLLESVQETIDIAREGGARANISHHKACGRSNWGKVRESCALIHAADIPVTHDVYPYTAASTTIWGTVPPSLQRLGQEGFLAFLKEPENVKALRDAIFHPQEDFDNAVLNAGYDGILILNAAVVHDAEGKSIRQYADALGVDPFDAYVRLMVENQLGVTYADFEMAEEDVRTLIADPACLFGTDALYMKGMDMTHPRAIGSFPRILGRYVREERVLTLAQAVRKMTGLPAETYGLARKGRIVPGCDADLVLFDAERICDHADYAAPLTPNEGIEEVYVNGALAVLHGKATGVRNGRTLRPAQAE